ncbi:ribosome biogenesis GTP-binding protein YihA/YsxC [Pseudorhodoplanes sp.]|uniref:ribosome biogenesis GTP-binding protein YihA/YsxC n=1 Tax=Pseudorhodoplanes sp. TaxID=1934341 RepID=UPI00391CBC86
MTIGDDFTRGEIEAGRKLFAGAWEFFWAAASVETLPPMKGLEIAFAGRSNAGKSSLINAVTGRKALARTSHTPGRTQEIVFFQGPDNMRIADMPGYGYAEAPKAKVKAWTALIHAYLQGRANLARVYVLIDARHGIKEADRPALELLKSAAVSHQIVLTKCDQLSAAALSERVAAVSAEMAKNAAAFPDILATSSREGTGIAELRAAIARLLAERR